MPHENLLQESCVEQLNSLQTLEQLVPLTAAKEHLPQYIINILELLGKADNIPFNQLYSLAEDCTDGYYTKVIKALTQLLKGSFNDRQIILLNMARALKFLESIGIDKPSYERSYLNMTNSLIISMTYKLHCKQSFIF